MTSWRREIYFTFRISLFCFFLLCRTSSQSIIIKKSWPDFWQSADFRSQCVECQSLQLIFIIRVLGASTLIAFGPFEWFLISLSLWFRMQKTKCFRSSGSCLVVNFWRISAIIDHSSSALWFMLFYTKYFLENAQKRKWTSNNNIFLWFFFYFAQFCCRKYLRFWNGATALKCIVGKCTTTERHKYAYECQRRYIVL